MNLKSLSKLVVLGSLTLTAFSIISVKEISAGSGPSSNVLNTLVDRGTVYTRTYTGEASSYMNDYTLVSMPEGVFAITDVKSQYLATAPHGKKIFAQAFIGVSRDSKGRYIYNLYSKISGESEWKNINIHLSKAEYKTDFELIVRNGKVLVYYKDPIWGNLVVRESKDVKTWSSAFPLSFEGIKKDTGFSIVKRDYYVEKYDKVFSQFMASFVNIKGNLVTMISDSGIKWSIVDITQPTASSELVLMGAYGVAQFAVNPEGYAGIRAYRCTDYATCSWSNWQKLSSIALAGEIKATPGFYGQFGSILVAAREKSGYIQTMDIQLQGKTSEKPFIFGDFINTNFVSEFDPALYFDNISSIVFLSALSKEGVVYEKIGANSKFAPVVSKTTGAFVTMQTFNASYQAL
jgi:hypothetical protein